MMENIWRIPPPVFPVGRVNILQPVGYKLNNGTPVFFIEAGTEDIVRMEFNFGAGQIREYLPMLAQTTNQMLTEGSRNYSARELHRILDYFGAFVHHSADRDRARLIIFSLNKHIEKVLELSNEILILPVFPENELNIFLNKKMQSFLISREKVQNLANDKFFESVFGKRHPYGHQIVKQDFENLNPPVLADFHLKYYNPGNMAIIVSGKIPENTIDLLNRSFGKIKHKDVYIEENRDKLKGEKRKKTHINKPGTIQTAIRIGSSTINKRHPDYPGLKVLDTLLGGFFGSRLMKNIREDKGYTYGIRSYLSSMDLSGFKIISTEVGHEYLGKALDEIYREIQLLQHETVGLEELEVVRNYMLGEMLRMFDGPFATAESFISALIFGLDNSYYAKFDEKIRTIEPDEIKYLAETYYKIDDLYEVTAGSE